MTSLYGRLAAVASGSPLFGIRCDEARDLRDLLERTANAINRAAAIESRYVDEDADPIAVIEAWLDNQAAREAAQEADNREIVDAAVSDAVHRLRERCAAGVTHGQSVLDVMQAHVARTQADAELEAGVVLALADWLSHRNERDSDG